MKTFSRCRRGFVSLFYFLLLNVCREKQQQSGVECSCCLLLFLCGKLPPLAGWAKAGGELGRGGECIGYLSVAPVQTAPHPRHFLPPYLTFTPHTPLRPLRGRGGPFSGPSTPMPSTCLPTACRRAVRRPVTPTPTPTSACSTHKALSLIRRGSVPTTKDGCPTDSPGTFVATTTWQVGHCTWLPNLPLPCVGERTVVNVFIYTQIHATARVVHGALYS